MPLAAKDALKIIRQLATITDGSGYLMLVKKVIGLEPGVTAASLGKAEGGTHADGDVGVANWAVQADVPASTTTNGKYAAVRTDAYGRTWVNIGRDLTVCTETPTITAGGYDHGDVMGGLIEFDGAHRLTSGSGRLTGCVISDKAGQKCPMQLWLFDSSPATGSTLTDNNAPVIHADHMAKLIDIIPIRAEDWHMLGSKSWAKVQMDRGFKLSGGTSLWGVLVNRQSEDTPPTYASDSDLSIRLLIEQ